MRRSGGSGLEDICLFVAVVVWRTFAGHFHYCQYCKMAVKYSDAAGHRENFPLVMEDTLPDSKRLVGWCVGFILRSKMRMVTTMERGNPLT